MEIQELRRAKAPFLGLESVLSGPRKGYKVLCTPMDTQNIKHKDAEFMRKYYTPASLFKYLVNVYMMVIRGTYY